MKKITVFALTAVLTAHFSLAAQRTFVASSGNDANPCTRDLPCRSFATAIASTSPNGEVVALDSAGYGPFTVTQSVAIIGAPGVHAAITVPSGNGIAVSAGAS